MTAPEVTFLFTDIEGSTRRWEADPTAMSAALARHDQLLRRALEHHDGVLFKHTGDGMCAAFATAVSALPAAIEAQQALLAQDWSEVGGLRVRMALHTGVAERRGGDYFGQPLNRTSRLLRSAHGGQVVVSLPTQELLRDLLPAGASLLDRGEHRLADLARPERIFVLTHPDLPADFPPLRSLDPRRHNLPVALSPFVGREYELKEVANLLGTARLVTLTGPGGAGKTRLALQAAANAVDAFSDGVFLVELASLTDPDLVVQQVVAAIGMSELETAPEGLLDQLCDHLRTRRLLLILDNCEHLVDAAAACCQALLAHSPRVVLLATSRESLGVPGEFTWRVPSLSLPPVEATDPETVSLSDAVALFCERARAGDSGFRLTSENAGAVAQISRRLDGIPLALELAAARLRVLSPTEIARRLDDRFHLLTGGARTALARHQTLGAALDWGYDLLSDEERALLQRLSVFSGSFTLVAAEALGGGTQPSAVLDLLGHLVEKSWVGVEDWRQESRYRLLETVRQYAWEKLAQAGQTEATCRRHRDFFFQLAAEQAGYPLLHRSSEWMRRLRPDEENLRAAMEWSFVAGDAGRSLELAAVLGNYWSFTGRLSETRLWLERALAEDSGPPGRSRVGALNALGYVFLQQGRSEQALSAWEDARRLAADLGDEACEAAASAFLGSEALRRGDLDCAERLLEHARQARAAEGTFLGAWSEGELAWVALGRGDVHRARALFERWLDIGRTTSAEEIVAHALAALAPLAALAGEADRARAMADEALEIARRLELPPIAVMALIRGAEAAILALDTPRAEHALRESLGLLRQIGGQAWVADALELTALLRPAGEASMAALLMGSAAALRQSAGAPEPPRAVAGELTRCRSQLTRQLGHDGFAEAWERGRRTKPDQAILHALEALSGAGEE